MIIQKKRSKIFKQNTYREKNRKSLEFHVIVLNHGLGSLQLLSLTFHLQLDSLQLP